MAINIEDIIFIFIVLCLLLVSVIVLINIINKEKNMEIINKAKKDMIDLEAITKNLETNYKPLNIELTSYEQEQENNAIISYEELVNSKDNRNINYDETYENNTDLNVKKVNLKDNLGELTEERNFSITLMSYEKEEAFLKALRQLQSDLAR